VWDISTNGRYDKTDAFLENLKRGDLYDDVGVDAAKYLSGS
jgi:hypothetical protein